MLLSKAWASSHLLVLCLGVCTFTNIYSQNQEVDVKVDDYITIRAKDKYHFAITNISGARLGILTNRNQDTTFIKPSKSKFLSNRQLGDGAKISIYLTKNDWADIIQKYDRVSIALKKDIERFKRYDRYVRQRAAENKRQERGQGFWNKVGEYSYKVVSAGTKIGHKKSEQHIIERYNYYTNLLVATNFSGKIKTDPVVNLIPVYLDDVLRDQRNHQKREVNHANVLLLGVGAANSNFGDNWESGYSITAPTYYAHYARRLWKGFHLGGNTYTALYGFGTFDSYGHRIVNKEQNFFVSRDYVENPTQDFYEIVSENDINLRNYLVSAGLSFRTYVFDAISIDIGAGYIISEWSLLNFKDEGDDDEAIQHLNNATLRKNRFSDVIEYDTSPIYGVVNLGWTFASAKKNTDFGIFVLGKFWQRELTPNNNFQIFEEVDGSFEKISITDGKELFYAINFGLTLGF